MRFPVNVFEKDWYDAQPFGSKTDYGFHEGTDLNLKTGGNSDEGQYIFAIADGVVTSVHNHTTTPTYGSHVHIQHDGPWGTVWSHCAHCSEVLVKVGQSVKEGDLIGKVGHTGTQFSHLHFAIKLQPTGIDGVAHTKEDLLKWTEPIQFIKKWITLTTSQEKEDMALQQKVDEFLTKFKFLDLDDATKVILENMGTSRGAEDQSDSGFLGSARREVTSLNKSLDIQTELAKQRQEDIISIARALDLKTSFDVPSIKAEISALLDSEDSKQELEDKLKDIQSVHEKEKADLTASYEKKLSDVKIQAENLMKQINTLETQLTALKAKDNTVSWITSLINSLFKK